MAQAMTAVYDTLGAAETARDGLLAMNIPEADICLRGTGGNPDPVDPATGGFWRNLFDIFIPQSEHPTYLEGMRRGKFMVAVQVPEGREAAAERVLERCGPIDLDDHAENWRKEGWTGHAFGKGARTDAPRDQPAPAVAGMGGAAVMCPGGPAPDAAGKDPESLAQTGTDARQRSAGGSWRVRKYPADRPLAR